MADPTFIDLIRLVKKRRWVILAVACLVMAGAYVYTQFQVPIYKAQGMVKYEPPGGGAGNANLAYWDQAASMRTQIRMLSSEDLIAAVAKKIGKPAGFSAQEVRDTSLISISATHRDPKEAADVVNAAMDVFAEKDMAERSTTARKALEDVSSRRREIEASLAQLEEVRKEYLENNPGTGMGGALTSNLVELEARRREMLKRFTPEHPEVVAIDQRLQSVRARLSKTPGQDLELERLNRDIKVNEEIYIALSKQVEESKVALSGIPIFVTIISRAAPPPAPFYPRKQMNYLMGLAFGLALGLIAAFMLESMDVSISTIEEIESVTGMPVLAVVPHLGVGKRWENLKKGILRKERYSLDAFRSMLLFHQKAKSPAVEVYHSLRSAIQSASPGIDHRVLAFTSTGVAEGKTLTSINFSLAAAHAGLKVLLVGADLRRPVLYRIFGLPKQPGFMEALSGKGDWKGMTYGTVDFLMGEVDLDKLLSFSGIDNFKVMTGWAESTSDVVNLLSADLLPKFIESARPHFDYIVFDCPPTLLFVDSVLIAAHCDAAVMVYQTGKMARQALKRAKDQLTAANVKILGLVLNDMQSSAVVAGYSYYDGYSYYEKQD